MHTFIGARGYYPRNIHAHLKPLDPLQYPPARRYLKIEIKDEDKGENLSHSRWPTSSSNNSEREAPRPGGTFSVALNQPKDAHRVKHSPAIYHSFSPEMPAAYTRPAGPRAFPRHISPSCVSFLLSSLSIRIYIYCFFSFRQSIKTRQSKEREEHTESKSPRRMQPPPRRRHAVV